MRDGGGLRLRLIRPTCSRHQADKVFAEANSLADEDGYIALDDRKHVAICPINDIESVLAQAIEDSLLASLKALNDEQYEGWMPFNVRRDTGAAAKFANRSVTPLIWRTSCLGGAGSGRKLMRGRRRARLGLARRCCSAGGGNESVERQALGGVCRVFSPEAL
jgi:hypothetical protein